ncbi:MAG: zf-HC2 domain-containing protein [Acidobacteria bacterium]|nr:zf-HC2 domain-containing protein [Acidobacteriota bacterium]
MSGNEHLREEQVVPYLDKRLGAAERAAIDGHLQSCAECRTRVAGLRGVLDVLGEWRAADPSPGLVAAVRTRVEAEARAKAWPWRWRWVYAGVVVAAAVILLVVGVWSPTPSPPTGAGTEFTQSSEPTGVSDDLATVEPVILEDYDLLRDFDILFEVPATTGTTPEKRGT